MLSLLLFSCICSRDFSLTRESNPMSDYRRLRLLSLKPRIFLYCPHSTTLSFRLQFPSFSISFLWIPWVVHSLASVFSPTLLSGSSGIAVSSCSVLAVFPRFLISVCGVFSLIFRFICLFCPTLFVFVLPSFMHAESVHEFALLACCYSRWVFKVRVIINGCILMSKLLFGLCFRCCF